MAGSPGYRVIDVEAQPVQHCSFLSCSDDATDIEVSGVAIENVAPNNHTQTFGYGPGAGNGTTTLPGGTSTITNASLGATVAKINGRVADFDSPFGDGNYFYVVENSNDTNAAPRTNANCTDHTDVSTERNWWLANLIFSDDNNAGVRGHGHFGGGSAPAPGGMKLYKSAAYGNTDCWLVTYYDNEVPPVNGVDASGSDVLRKIDEVVQNRMKRWGLLAVALGIVKDGNLIYHKGYGYSDLGNFARRAADRRSAASVSKPIRQSLILRLVQSGDINLNDKPFAPSSATTHRGRRSPARGPSRAPARLTCPACCR